MRVGGCQPVALWSGGLCCYAVRQTHCSGLSLIVASPKQAGTQRHTGLNSGWRGQAQLGQIERRLFLIGAHQTYEVIKDLSDAEGSESCVFLPLDELLDLGRSRFVLEESEDRKGIENDHLRRSFRASSSLD